MCHKLQRTIASLNSDVASCCTVGFCIQKLETDAKSRCKDANKVGYKSEDEYTKLHPWIFFFFTLE